MKEIQLNKGYVALIDDEMVDRVSYFKWRVQTNGITAYVITSITLPNGKQVDFRLHDLIMGCPVCQIDHISRNGLDNRVSNLRPATQQQNCMNRTKQRGTTSIYRGVSWYPKHEKWVVHIKINGKQKHLGYFDKDHEHMAAMAYDLQAIEHFGEFANLNLFIHNKL
jgi:hypothetical protein